MSMKNCGLFLFEKRCALLAITMPLFNQTMSQDDQAYLLSVLHNWSSCDEVKAELVKDVTPFLHEHITAGKIVEI